MPTSPRNRQQRGYRAVWVLGLLCLALTPSLGEAQSEAPWVSMTLEEARARALEHSPQITQATGAIRTAAAAERSAFGAYLPGLALSAGSALASSERFNPDTNTPVTGSHDSYNAGLSASWEVFTGGRRSAERSRAQAETQAAEARLTEQRFAVGLSVERSFFEALRAEELMVVAQARIERALEGVGAAERRLAVGSATRSDVLRARLEHNTAREALLQLENQRYTAALALGRLVGLEAPVDPAPSGPIEPAPLQASREELVATLVSQAPVVRAAEASLVTAVAGIDSARAQYMPSVRLSAGYDWFNQDFGLTGGRTAWSVRLGLSYPIFNGFVREEGVVRARTQAEIAQSQLADVRRAVRAEAERVLSVLQLVEERLSLARQAVEVAQEDLRVQQERYRLGATTILELLTSQSALVEAENRLVSLRFDYQLSRAELEAIVGRAL
jgi:outer membrane protein